MILVDTSVWIEYFRGKSKKVVEEINNLLETRSIAICGVIIGELLAGARNKEFQSKIIHLRYVCKVIGDSLNDWIEAGILNKEIQKKGKRVGLTDCYIAQIAIKNRISVWSYDKDFKVISEVSKLHLI